MFIDIALSQDQKPIRIAIYEDSDPEKIAKKFITQQGITNHYEELVAMMQQAKQKALSEQRQ